MTINNITDLQAIAAEYNSKSSAYRRQVFVCGGGACISSSCQSVRAAVENYIKETGIASDVSVTFTGCMGMCALGPIMYILPEKTFYVNMTPEKAVKVMDIDVLGGEIIEEYTFYDASSDRHIPCMDDIPFFKKQVQIALRNCGKADFASIESYIALDGFQGIVKALGMTRQEVVNEMKKSGLRGRGGAGFPTGVKWEAGLNAAGDKKFIVCNADEGDPGAFMDRSLIEGDPFGLIEGMMIGAYAIGADKGFVYVRAEYPIAVERLNAAIEVCREAGILGNNIFGSDFCFDLETRIGAGAFVCGEETSLMNSIQGERGEPRQKPPFPFQKGLFGFPTIINNVETFANVPAIIFKGADWFADYGYGNSRGTKVFALAGDIVNTGIVEVPMGTTLRELVYDIGGGIQGDKRFKAAQIGGPSGGCITDANLDTPVDYDTLTRLGAIMGSGGLIVMDEDTCMVDTARFFLDFIQDESCGKCVPCRIGTKRMLEILERITHGKGQPDDLAALEELAENIKNTAMCGLGQTAPNPVLSTMKYFRSEYEQHIFERKCIAGVCQSLLSYIINPEKCRGCTACTRVCPAGAISGEVKKPHTIDKTKCIKCGACLETCKFGAIKKV